MSVLERVLCSNEVMVVTFTLTRAHVRFNTYQHIPYSACSVCTVRYIVTVVCKRTHTMVHGEILALYPHLAARNSGQEYSMFKTFYDYRSTSEFFV